MIAQNNERNSANGSEGFESTLQKTQGLLADLSEWMGTDDSMNWM